MARPTFVIASNRGPVSYALEDGELTSRRGAGGLVSGLGPIVRECGALWIAAAMSEADRRAAASGVRHDVGSPTLLVDVDPDRFRASYDVVCNQLLWFVHHGMFDRMRTPRIDRTTAAAWDDYRAVNVAFAEAIAAQAPEGARVLVQDYHLALVAPALRAARPDVAIAHFSHTPFATPEELEVLPASMRDELLAGMAAADVCAFHSERWRRAFAEGAERWLGEHPRTAVTPLGSDPDDIRSTATSEACAEAGRRLAEAVGDRTVLARVDRIEPSKNLLRGFEAFELLLDEHPEWHDRVVFAASVYPSRQGLARYRAYRQEVETRVRLINERFATADWTPVLLDTRDDFPASVALMARADVMLVNPVRDGLNLVATEAALVSERDAVVLLSRGAGVFDLLGEAAIEVPAHDVGGTADAIVAALGLGPEERAERAAAVRRAATRTPADWLDEQLALLG